MPLVDQHLDILSNCSFVPFSELIDEGAKGRRSTDGPLVEVLSVRADLSASFNLVPIN